MAEEKNQKEDRFAVLAESKDYGKPLLLTGLSFARLIDDVVFPVLFSLNEIDEKGGDVFETISSLLEDEYRKAPKIIKDSMKMR